jgi:hypothetical protein
MTRCSTWLPRPSQPGVCLQCLHAHTNFDCLASAACAPSADPSSWLLRLFVSCADACQTRKQRAQRAHVKNAVTTQGRLREDPSMPDSWLLSSRRGGGKRIPGVRYGEKALRVTPQLLWRAGTEGACTGVRPESQSRSHGSRSPQKGKMRLPRTNPSSHCPARVSQVLWHPISWLK